MNVKSLNKNLMYLVMVVITVILSLVYYVGDISFSSFASSYIGDNATISFSGGGGGGTASIVASERPVLIVGLGPDSRIGMNMPVENGENTVIEYYKDYMPTLKYTSTAITIVGNKVAQNANLSKTQLAWYHPGETVFRTTGTHSGVWQNSIIWGMDSNADPTGGAGVYRTELNNLSANGQMGDWKTLVTADKAAISKRLWGYFGTLQSSGGRYSFLAADRIKAYMGIDSLDFNNIKGWSAEDSTKAAIAHVDLLMTLYSVVKDQVPDAAAEYEKAIDEYLQNGTSPGEVTPTCNIVLYPGVLWEYSKTKQDYVASIYDIWNYTYGVNATGYLGNDNFKEIAEITGAIAQDDVYVKLHTATTYMLNGLLQAGQQPNINGGAFSYVTNFAFAKRTSFSAPYTLVDRASSSRFMAESLYLNPLHKGLNVIIAPPSQFSTSKKFDAEFSVIWARDNSNHFVASSDNVNDTVQFRINMKVPDEEKANWKAIFDKYDKFQIAFTPESNNGDMRKAWSTTSEGATLSPVAAPSYFINGQYAPGTFIDIGKEELRRYLLNGNTYMGLTDQAPKNQVIQYAEMQQYAYNLTVSIKYGDGTTSSTVTSSKTGWTIDTTDADRKKHKVTVSRDGDPLSKVTYYSSPEAFAEFKEGTVSRTSNGSKETFEAMSGVPSTETMYFTSGGSEFILEMELELVQKESAWRDYVEAFFGTECEFKRNDQFRSSATAGNSGGGFGGSFSENTDNKFTATFVADADGNDQKTTGVQDQHMHMYKADGAVSYTNVYNGHDASLPTPQNKDKGSYGSSTASQSNDSNSTTFTAMWTGTIANITPDKGNSETYARGAFKEANTSPSCSGGYAGHAGDFTESTGTSAWDVSKLNEAAKQAHEWAAKYEATNTASGKKGNYEKYDNAGSGSQGTASKLADSDGIERVWNIGEATISVSISGGRSNQGTGSYYGDNYTTSTISTVENLLGNNANFGYGNSFSYGSDGTAGSHGASGSPPNVDPHGADSDGSETVPSTVSAVGDLSYTIKVTFSNGTLSAHALCGPECQHDLPTIYDSWSQKYTYDYVRLNVARVYKIHRSYVDGMEEITLVNYGDAEDASQNAFNMEWMHGAKSGRHENITAATQSKRHNGTDTIVAAISQGDPNIFYNIANMQPEYYRTSGTGKEAKRPAMAGRMRCTYQVQQMDYVYTEEMTRRGNIKWANEYNCVTGSRSNKCDGLGGTVDSNNPAKYKDQGHETKWANGFLYNRGYQNYSGRTEGEQYWFTDIYGNTGLCEDKGKGTQKEGYTDNSLDDKDVKTEEYARLKYRRNSDNTMYIVSDMLLLQTSAGDQPALYYQSPPQTQTLQKWYEYDQTDRNAHQSKNVPLRGTLFQNKMENIWNNNKNCAFNWGNNNIGQHGDVNVGGYTGEYQEPDNKFSTVSYGAYFGTIFDCTGGAKKLNDLDATIGHPLQWVDQKYGPGGGDSKNEDNEDYGANKVAFKDKYVGRQEAGFEEFSSSVGPGSVLYENVANVIDEVDPYSYKSTPNRCMKDNVAADIYNYADDYNGQRRMSRVKGMRIFTDKILQDPTNENKEYETGNAYQDYIMILNWDTDDTFVHLYEPSPVYSLDEDNKTTVDGYEIDAPYSREHEKINDFIVQDPVSVSDALLLHSDPTHDKYNDGYEWEEDFSKDSRTNNELLGATNLKKKIDELQVCPGDADLCDFRVLNCSFDEDKVVANFDFENTYTSKDGTKKTGVKIENGATYVTNTVNDNVYKLPDGFQVYKPVLETAYDVNGNKVNGVSSYNPYTIDGQRYEERDFGSTYTHTDDNGKEVTYWAYHNMFGESYGQYLKAYGTRWALPLNDLIGGHDSQTQLAVEMNVYTPRDTNTMYVSFNNYAFGIDVTNTGTLTGWNTGSGVSKYLKNSTFGGKAMRLKFIFDLGDANKSKVYINGQEATDYSLGAINDVKNSIGDYLNIGWWSKNNDGKAQFYIDNLKITRLAGTRQHTEDCYETVMNCSQTIQYTCQVLKEFNYISASNGEPELYIMPQSGRYKLEAFGAQGGGNPELAQGSHGGYGGYSYGFTHFNKGDKVLVYVGGQGTKSTGTREVYGWTLAAECGNYNKFVAAADETVSGISYKNSVTGAEMHNNWTGPIIWSETCPTGFECNAHSVSIATVTATGEMLSKVKATKHTASLAELPNKRVGGTYTASDFWYGNGYWTKNGDTLTSTGAYHLSGPNLQGIKGMKYRVTYTGANLTNTVPTVWDDYKSSTSQNTNVTVVKKTSAELIYEVTLGSNISTNAQSEFCLNATAAGVRIDKCTIYPLNYQVDDVAYMDSSSAGWNGGGYAGNGGYGGGGATDIRVLKYGGIYTVGSTYGYMIKGDNLWYGPYITAGVGHYQVDIYGTNLDKVTKYDVYSNKDGAHTYDIDQIFVSPTHTTLYFYLKDDLVEGGSGLEVRSHGSAHTVTKEVISRLEDRVIIGGGGGGADDTGNYSGSLGGSNDGSGGAGGGIKAGNAYVDGKLVEEGKALTDKLQSTVEKLWDTNKVRKAIKGVNASGCGRGAGADYGYALGYGESLSYTTDGGGAGGGLYGGFVTNHGNGGGAGGSGYIGSLSSSGCVAGTNKGNGRATIHFVAHEDNNSGSNKKLVGDYGYTGNVQVFQADVSGNYFFETWGASGGDGRMVNQDTIVEGSGGAGGYAAGTKYLAAGQKVYVYVGGEGGDAPHTPNSYGLGGWNGGGDGGTERSGENYPENAAGGGGASDVRTSTALSDRFIVAGGGGGAASHFEGASNTGATGVAGLQTKQEDGKTWARVLYQDISNNTNYFTSANMGSVNQAGLYSCLSQLEKFRGSDGKFEFMLDYPDATGVFAGAKNVWKQTVNPFDSTSTTNQGAKADSYPNVDGFQNIRMDMPGYAGHGLEYNGNNCVLDGTVGFGNWWLCVGIMNESYAPTNGAGYKSTTYTALPTNTVGSWNLRDYDLKDSNKWTIRKGSILVGTANVPISGSLHLHTGYDLPETKSGDVYYITAYGNNLNSIQMTMCSKESSSTGSWKTASAVTSVENATPTKDSSGNKIDMNKYRIWKVTSKTDEKCLAFCLDALAMNVEITKVDIRHDVPSTSKYTMPGPHNGQTSQGVSQVELWARIDNVGASSTPNANDPTRNGGAGGGPEGRSTNSLTAGGTQNSGYALGQGQPGFSCPNDGTNRGSIGGGGGGYYGGKYTSAPTNSYAYGGAGGSSYTTGLAEKTTVDGNNSMPSPTGNGNMIGNRGNGHVKIYLKDTVSNGHHTDECTFIQNVNNKHVHQASCITDTTTYTNPVLRQALNAEYNGDGTLLRQLLGEEVYWKLKGCKTIATINSWQSYDRLNTTWTDCSYTFDGNGGFILSDFKSNPHFGFPLADFDAASVDRIILNADVAGNTTKEAELYFVTDKHTTWDTCVKAEYVNGQAVFNMYTNPNWSGKVTSLSFDPIANNTPGGTCHVRSIEFWGLGNVSSVLEKTTVMKSLSGFGNSVEGMKGITKGVANAGVGLNFNNGSVVVTAGADNTVNWEFRVPVEIDDLSRLKAIRMEVQNISASTEMGVGISGRYDGSNNMEKKATLAANSSNWQTVVIPIDGWTGSATYLDIDAFIGANVKSGTMNIRKIEFIGYGTVGKAGYIEYTVPTVKKFNYTGGKQTFTTPYAQDYTLKVWGASGGGILDDTKSSHGGKGGYAEGKISLAAGKTLNIFVGGQGSGASAMGQGGGYNGGGQGGPGGYGGGGMTHISTTDNVATSKVDSKTETVAAGNKKYEFSTTVSGSGTYNMGEFTALSGGTISKIAFYTSNRHMRYFYLIEKDTGNQIAKTPDFHSGSGGEGTTYMSNVTLEQGKVYIIQVYSNCSNFRGTCLTRFETSGGTETKTTYTAGGSWNSNGTLIVAGGGGGADNSYDGAAVGTADDGSGGSGGGTTGGNARTGGTETAGTGGTQTSGFKQGVGGSATSVTDTGGGGAGWYGGIVTNHNNGGAGGGSGYTTGLTSASMKNGVRDGNGYAEIHYMEQAWHADKLSTHQNTLLGIKRAPMLGLDGTEEGIRRAMNAITPYAEEIPDRVDGEFNPIFICDRLYNTHVHDDRCTDGVKVLKCTEPHHYGMHYASSAEAAEHGHSFCYDPCNNDQLHKKDQNEITGIDGKTVHQQMYINTDEYFDIYFPNIGDFSEEPSLHGIVSTTSTRGMGYKNRMDTSMWTREKYVKFSVDTLFYREETKKWEQYTAGEWIELPVKGHSYPYYHFYCTLNNNEQAAATVEYEVEAINADNSNGKYNYKNYGYTRYDGTKMWYDTDFNFSKVDGTNHGMEDFIYRNYNCYKINGETASNHDNDNDNKSEVTNKKRSATFRSKHGAHKMYYYDVVGRIGNLFITDTDDLRFSNLFKLPKADGAWLIDGIVREVYENIQNYYLSWHYDDASLARDVRNRLVDRKHAMYNIWASQKWNGASDEVPSATEGHAIEIPLGSNTSNAHNPGQLLGDLLKPGYNVNFEITSTGDYGSDDSILQVKPYFYAMAIAEDRLSDGTVIKPGQLIPVDVHMKTDDGYKTINYFGAVDNTSTWEGTADNTGYKDKVYDFDLSLKWADEYLRRNYTDVEQKMTENLRDEMADTDPETGNEIKLPIVGGDYYSLGNVQILRADGHARSFIGTNRTVYEGTRFNGADDTNFDNKFNGLMYNYQAQRWHLKLGIPSSSVFTLYRNGKHLQAEDQITYGNNEIKAYELIKNSGKYVILMTANIKSLGDTWILYYGQNVDKNRKLAETSGQWSNGNVVVNGITYKANYIGPTDANGEIIPSEFRVILAVYDASDTSSVDYDIIGTH